jgi:CheY-like chemotaxis protein
MRTGDLGFDCQFHRKKLGFGQHSPLTGPFYSIYYSSSQGLRTLAVKMESTYDVFASADVPAFWPAFLSRQQQQAQNRSEVKGSEAGEQSKRCILVVDDHNDTLRSMKMLLTRLGYEVLAAENMTDALRIAEKQHFDILLSDIGLPDGSGLELLKRIRAKRKVPALALNGFGMDEDIERSEQAGFADHLTKPVSIDRLQAAIAELEAEAN